MTLKTDNKDYRGFIRIKNTVVEGCTLDGKSAYWGYETAKFTNSTFNAPTGDYALWGYSSKDMSFDNCTFNISGKGINLYVEQSPSEILTVAVNNCTVNSTKAEKAFLYIKNLNQAWNVVFSGTNTVTGLDKDATTGSDLYQVKTTDITSGKAVKVQEKAADGTLKTIFAVSNPAIVNETEYPTLKAAIEAASANDTVTLLANVNEDVTVASDKSITLDLNGYKLTNKADHTITNNGTLTITDSSADKTGTIDNVTHCKAPVENAPRATCTIEKANITRSLEAGTYSPDNANGNSYYYIENFGTMTIGAKGGNASDVIVSSAGGYSSLVHNGWYNGAKNTSDMDATMTINAGSFAGGKNTIKNDDYGNLTINGGSFNNTNQAAVFNVNKATINGGSFESTAEGVVYTAAYDQKMDWGVTKVYGGEFKSVGTSDFSLCNKGAVPTVTVHGGTFSKDPSAYVVSDYAALKGSDGNYVVAEKPAKEDTATEGVNSGSATTVGSAEVAVDNSSEVAKDAVAAANDVANIEVPEVATDGTGTTTIGGTTVKVDKAQADELTKVKAAAAADTSSKVDVNLVVKAGMSSKVDSAITEVASASSATVIPFALSVDMVTTVKDSNGNVKASASVPVSETKSAIKVTIKVAPESIKEGRVVVARNHNDKVDILPATVNVQAGTVTFETDKFSDYAVMVYTDGKSYELADYTDNGSRKTITPGMFGYTSDYVFAGWYKDKDLKDAYSQDDAEGTAYPAFVKVSDLISFKGGSLRMDLTGADNYDQTSLRFGYEMKVPAGATLNADDWGWTYANPETEKSGFVKAVNYWLTDGNGAITNLVIKSINKSGLADDEKTKVGSFTTSYQVTAQIGYTTADGTSVVAKDETQARSVNQVANLILGNPLASAAETTYANGILGKQQAEKEN